MEAQNPETIAEKTVLGMQFIRPPAENSLTSLHWGAFLLAHKWTTVPHAVIAQAIAWLLNERKPIDMVSVADNLKMRGKLNLLPGGEAYLLELANSVPTPQPCASCADAPAEDPYDTCRPCAKRILLQQTEDLARNFEQVTRMSCPGGGHVWRGPCPLCKTDTMTLTVAANRWHCVACGKGGFGWESFREKHQAEVELARKNAEQTRGVVLARVVSDSSKPKANLSAPEAAEFLGIHPRTVLDMAASGKLPAFRVGRRVLFPLEGLKKYIADNMVKAPECSNT